MADEAWVAVSLGDTVPGVIGVYRTENEALAAGQDAGQPFTVSRVALP
jgi:hypothetical protein